MMTSITPVSLNNIEPLWRCGLKSVFSGEVHSRKGDSSYDDQWMLRLRCYVKLLRCYVCKKVYFHFFQKIVTDFASLISRGNLFHKRSAATTNDE